MGTSGSYSGGGGSTGRDLRDEVEHWLDSLPNSPGDASPDSPDDGTEPDDQEESRPGLPQLPPQAVLNVIPMFRRRSGGGGGGDGPGGMAGPGGGSSNDGGRRSRGGGAQRTAAGSARTAGRAAAAAYAFGTGDADTLRDLGLDYDELRAADPMDVTLRIVEAACGHLSDGTIEGDEQRQVAAEVAEWVLEASAGGNPPAPEEIVREAIAQIIFEAAATETAQKLRDGGRPEWATAEGERQIRECAQALAEQAELSAEGPTVQEFERAIENGIETLREMWGDS